MGSLIVLESVSKKYEDVTAINGISLELPRTGMIFIKGKSGCGKTTLLNLLGGLDELTAGRILFEGKDTATFTQREWDEYRNRQIGFVFQDYNLLEGFSVEKNLEIALDIQNELTGAEDKKARICENLSFVELAGYEKRKVTQLSGGQKQRVAVARAVAKKCKLILADEPTGNLDSENSKTVLELLKRISKTRLVVVVTHDIAASFEYGDRIITISDGKITDDTELKRDNSLYSIRVEDGCGKTVLEITDEIYDDAKKLLAEWIIDKQGTNTFSFRVSKKQNVDLETENSIDESSDDVRTKRLTFGKMFTIARQNLSAKRVRLFFTSLIFVICIFLLLSVSFVISYDHVEAIGRYLQDSGFTEVYLVKTETYENRFFDIVENNITSGEDYYKRLQEFLPEQMLVPRFSVDMVEYVRGDTSSFAYDLLLISSDNFELLNRELLIGRYPNNDNEIAITDYIAENVLHDSDILGTELYIDGYDVAMKVVGIIRTDYIEKEIPLKVRFNNLDEFEYEDLINIYNTALVNSNYARHWQNSVQGLTLEKSNFFISEYESQYLKSAVNYASIQAKDVDLICGRMPQKDNEVIISSDMADRADFEEGMLGSSYSYIDLYSDFYGGAYSDTVNLYDYFPQGVIIVGIFDSMSDEVLISDEIYTKIENQYIQYYACEDYITLVGDTDVKKLTAVADEAGFIFSEPAIMKIYSFRDTIAFLTKIIAVFLVAIVVLTIFVLSTYFSNNIKVNTKKIGVLKAIGVQTNQISEIFMIESFAISVASYVLASVVMRCFIFLLNNILITQPEGHKLQYMYWNPGMAAITLLLTVVLSMGSVILPVWKMSKKKPVEIIRS